MSGARRRSTHGDFSEDRKGGWARATYCLRSAPSLLPIIPSIRVAPFLQVRTPCSKKTETTSVLLDGPTSCLTPCVRGNSQTGWPSGSSRAEQMKMPGRCPWHLSFGLKTLTELWCSKELCSVLYGSLDGRGVWGRLDTCIYMAEPLCCSPETITALLTGYIPIQKKKKEVWCSEGSTVESDIAQSCLTLCDPMDCSLLGSPIHGIFWARVLEWVAISTTTAVNSCLRIPSHSFIHSLENIEVRTIICLIQQSGFCRGPCLRDKQDNLFNVTLKGSENGTLNSQLVICQTWTWQNFLTEMLFVFWLSSPLDRTSSVSHSCFLFLSCIYISHFPGSP